VFDHKKHQHTFGVSAGERSGFTIDISIFAWDHIATLTRKNVIMVNIEELSKEDQRKYTELQEYIKQQFLSGAKKDRSGEVNIHSRF
jgi:Fe-S cluster biosynthesis and repair protein YggX